MVAESCLRSVLGKRKIVMGMLHLKGDSDAEILERLKREYDAYVRGGIDGVVVENYYNTYDAIELALTYLDEVRGDCAVGVNCLRSESMGFEAALAHKTDFVQTDSVVGHVAPRDDASLESFFSIWRKRYTGVVLGGVRFKKQPFLSMRPLEEDLQIARGRCDAVCVTQDRTGQETSVEKIKAFRDGLGGYPLLISAGATPKNVARGLKYADGVIAGSYFKEGHEVSGDVQEEYVRELVCAVHECEGGAR